MARLTVSLLSMLLLGCPVPASPVEPACAHSVDGWYGGLGRHLQRADVEGRFQYEADEAWIGSYAGRWDRHGGSFSSSTRYAEGYFLVAAEAAGLARMDPDGDYELRWDQRIVDVLGVEQRAGVRERRQGCAVEQVFERAGATVTTTAWIVDDDTVQGSVTSTDSDFDVTATWHADHSAELSYAGHDGESWYEVLEPGDGTREASYHLAYSGGTEDGGYLRAFDGAREYRFDRFPDEGEWAVLHYWWLLNYDGSGEGEVVGEGYDGTILTCWYEWDAQGVGSYTCDDGTSGPY
jgi:hypothetical protein